MRIVLSTDSIKGYGLNRVFEVAKEAGFEGIDLKINPECYDTTDSDYIKKLQKEFDMPVVALQTHDQYTTADIEQLVEIAKAIGTKIITLKSPSLLDFSMSNWLKKEVPKIRKKEEISIALENAKEETYLGIIPKKAMNNIVEMKKFKHACLDTSMIAQRGADALTAYNNLQDFLVHIRVSNAQKGKYYKKLEDGAIPIESLLAKLKDNEYLGAISIKINPAELHVDDRELMVKTLKDQIAYCHKYTK